MAYNHWERGDLHSLSDNVWRRFGGSDVRVVVGAVPCVHPMGIAVRSPLRRKKRIGCRRRRDQRSMAAMSIPMLMGAQIRSRREPFVRRAIDQPSAACVM